MHGKIILLVGALMIPTFRSQWVELGLAGRSAEEIQLELEDVAKINTQIYCPSNKKRIRLHPIRLERVRILSLLE